MGTSLKHPGEWICPLCHSGSVSTALIPWDLQGDWVLGLLTENGSQTGLLPQEFCQIPAPEGRMSLWDAAALTVQDQGRV